MLAHTDACSSLTIHTGNQLLPFPRTLKFLLHCVCPFRGCPFRLSPTLTTDITTVTLATQSTAFMAALGKPPHDSKKISFTAEENHNLNLKGDDEGGGITTSKWSFKNFFPPCGFEGQKGRGHVSLPYWKESEEELWQENSFLLTSTVTKSKQNFGLVSKLPLQRRKISVCSFPKLLSSKNQKKKKRKR